MVEGKHEYVNLINFKKMSLVSKIRIKKNCKTQLKQVNQI